MAKRRIVQIDEERCTGCGLCIPNCAEGAIQILDGKAKLINDRFCDGLGACLGHCPEDAITVIEREAEGFDEKAVEMHQRREKAPHSERQGHASPLKGCPSSRPMHFNVVSGAEAPSEEADSPSMLGNWPVQLKLVPVNAPYFDEADLLVTADCVPVAYPAFHRDFLKGKSVVVGCPKLDDAGYYAEKLAEIFKTNRIRTVTLLYMEVPCCYGLVAAAETAMRASGKNIPLTKVKIGIQGKVEAEGQERTTICTHGPAHV
jgi:Pyruvate/2-oxoacid:ferredoxin oxidoreductase delta subunit